MKVTSYRTTVGLCLLAASILAFPFSSTAFAQSFTVSSLNGFSITNPTCMRWGPDGRLYVSQQDGVIKAFSIVRNGPNNYSVTGSETITLIHDIPNHDDSTGAVNANVIGRQTTGILLTGTAANPIIYATSGDIRQGLGGSNPDTGQDTNSGMISRLTWNGSSWNKIDLVRGLPRSKTSHATNDMVLDTVNNILYLAVGGNTNAGAPASYSAWNCEYALGSAILRIDLSAINALATQGSGNSSFKYNLPTLDDPNRTNNADGSDPNDPFGGDHGLNQAKLVAGGPVQVYASGLRNPYCLVLTKTPGKDRRLYTIDNGPDNGIGALVDGNGNPSNGCNATNNFPASTDTSQTYSSREQLHYI